MIEENARPDTLDIDQNLVIKIRRDGDGKYWVGFAVQRAPWFTPYVMQWILGDESSPQEAVSLGREIIYCAMHELISEAP